MSMATFINAMATPDRACYPVAGKHGARLPAGVVSPHDAAS